MKRTNILFFLLLMCILAAQVRAGTVSVATYGAIANDGRDDVAAFEAARNAAGAGGTVQIPEGVFNFGRQFDPGANRSYVGVTAFHCENWNTPMGIPIKFILDKSTTIKPSGNFHAFRVTSSGVSLRSLTFEGRGVWVENGAIAIDRLLINGCWFKLLVSSGDHKSAVQFQTWLTNSQITNNVFDPIQGEVGIYGYRWSGLTIANNALMNGVEGIHTIGKGDVKDLLIQQNYFARLSRMGTENQESGWNTVVEDNWYEAPAAFTNDTMAYSVVNDQAIRPIVRRNVHLSPRSAETPDRIGVRIIFELGGKNIDAYDNYSDGGNHVVAVNGAGSTGRIHDNKFMNFRESPRNANGSTATFTNNGPNVNLSFDPKERGRPGPFRRYGEPDPDPEPPPIVVPPVTPPTTQPQRKVAKVTVEFDDGQIQILKP